MRLSPLQAGQVLRAFGLNGALALGLSACGGAPMGPLTMPPPDGRDEIVAYAPSTYVVNRQAKAISTAGIVIRVTRKDARDFDYSEGARAKAVAETYCKAYNRKLDPRAMGRFSLPNAWVFDGDCV